MSSRPTSSTSRQQSDSSGASYTFKLYTFHETNLYEECVLPNEGLLGRFENMIDTSEKITEVMFYTNLLTVFQLQKNLLYQAYIVFKTDNWWWSIENKDEESGEKSILLQRSKKIELVRDNCRGINRQEGFNTKIECQKTKAVGDKTIKQLVQHVQGENFLNEEFHSVENNSKDFADNIYEFL